MLFEIGQGVVLSPGISRICTCNMHPSHNTKANVLSPLDGDLMNRYSFESSVTRSKKTKCYLKSIANRDPFL